MNIIGPVSQITKCRLAPEMRWGGELASETLVPNSAFRDTLGTSARTIQDARVGQTIVTPAGNNNRRVRDPLTARQFDKTASGHDLLWYCRF